MFRHLLCWVFIFSGSAAFTQAPGWQWGKDASSTDQETAWDVAYDASSTSIYIGGRFKGNLSALYGPSFTASYGNSDGFLAKYDQLGNVIWALKLGGTNDDEVHSVAVDPSGNIYVTGYFTGTADFDPTAAAFTLSSSGGHDGFLAKYTSAGALAWAVKFGGTGNEDSWKMSADVNGIYITGSYESLPATFYSYGSATTKTAAVSDNQLNAYGAKYDASGIVQWVISGGSDKDDIGYNVVADAANVYFIGRYEADLVFKDALGIAGTTLQAQQNNKPQVYILAATQTGSLVWKTNITSSSGGDMVVGWGLAQDAANLYVTGYMDGNINFKYPSPTLSQNLSAGGNVDLYLAKLTKTGTFTWRTSATGSGTGEQIGRALEVDASGNIILGGCFTSGLNYSSAGGPNFSSSGGHDIFVTAYSNTGSFLWSTKAGGNTRDYLNGMSLDNSGSIYVAGEQDGGMVIGTTTLSSGGGLNVFVAKLGCSAIANNTISASQTICSGNAPSSLSGSVPSGGTFYTWQKSPDGVTWTNASGTYTSQNYVAPSLTSATYYQRLVSSSGSCSLSPSGSNTVLISVDVPPSTAFAGDTQSVCDNSVTLNASIPSSGTGTWSVLSGGGGITSVSSFSSQVTGLSTGTNAFVWTVSNGVCASSTSTVTIIRFAVPTASAGVSQTLCSAGATMNAVNPAVGTGAWTLLSGSGLVTSTTNPVSPVTSLGTGISQFVWTVSNGICPAASSTVTLTRDEQPTSNAGVSQTLCTSTATLTAISPTTGTGIWSVAGGTATLLSVANYSTLLTGLSTGTNQFVWIVSNGICPAASSTVTLTRDAQPTSDAGSNQNVCASTATLTAISPTVGTGIWSVAGGTATLLSVANYSTLLTGLDTGINQFVWTVSNGICPAASSTVTLIRDEQPTSNAGVNQTLCTSTATLTAVSPTIGTGIWSVSSGTGTLSSAANYSTVLTGLGTGTNQFVWTVSNGVCPAASSTVILIRDALPASNAGVSQTVCASNATLGAAGAGAWTLLTGSGTITSVTNPSSTVLSLGTGANQFVWTVSSGVCPDATSTVTLTRDVLPVANAGITQTVCSPTAVLAAVSPTTGTGMWSVSGGPALVTSSISYSSAVTSLATGTNVFVWTVTNGICPAATAPALIIRDAMPTASAGADQTVCASAATLAAINPTLGSGAWSVLTGPGTITAVSNPLSQVTSLAGGSNRFLWTVTNGVCPTATSTVTLTREIQPTAAAGINQTVCASDATFSAVSPIAGSGSWSVLSGTSSVSSSTNPASTVNFLSVGLNMFVWTVSNGVCPAATSTVTITRDAQPQANAGSDQTVCISTATLAAISPTLGTGSWSVISGGGTILTTGASAQVTALATGSNSFMWTVSSGICPAATSTMVITRNTVLTASAGGSQSVCSSSATLAAITPTAGNGLWSVLTGTAAISTNTNAGTSISGLNTGLNTFLWTVSDGFCPVATSSVNIWRDLQPGATIGTDQTICSSTATLNATAPTIGTGLWSIVSGTATSLNFTAPSAILNSVGTGTNIFMWTVANGVCMPATSTVAVVRDQQPVAQAGSDQTLCVQNTSLAAVAPSTGNGLWSVLSGTGVITSFTNPFAPVSALGTGTNVFLWTVTNGVCPSATSAVTIIQDMMPASFAGTDQTICSSTATLDATAPSIGTGVWSVVSGTATSLNLTAPSAILSSVGSGTNMFMWTVTNGVCPPATSTVTIVRDMNPGMVNAGSDFTVCAPACTLSAVTTTPGNASWSVLSGTSSLSSVSNASAAVSNLSNGINQFVWTNANGSCPPSRDTVSIYFTAPLPAAAAGPDQQVCSSESTLSANNAGYGFWSVNTGSAVPNNPAGATTSITSLNAGANVFVWTVSKPFCPATTDTVIIYRNENPGNADAGANQRVCGQTATLAAMAPIAGNGAWKVLQGSAQVSDTHLAQAILQGLSEGANKLMWTIENGVCPLSSDTLIILSDKLPSEAFAGKDLLVCQDDIDLHADAPETGSGAWALLSGTCTILQPTVNTTFISGLKEGVYVLKWTITNGVCPQSADTVEITRTFTPVNPDAGPDQILETSTAQLIATIPQKGVGTWSVISGSCEISDPHDKHAFISNLPFGTTVLRWTIANKSCPDVSDDIVVNVKNLNIPNAFSPNGDGINDTFEITSLAYYKDVKLSVFNRWGTLLYHNETYENNWAGINANNEKLADDTYYYIIEIRELKNFTGFVIIKRD